MRLVTVEVDGHTLQIIGLDIEAELIALIYHYRWQVELFFKWLKCILGCSHLLADSSSGVTIQVYCALIGALMLQMLTGRRPSKREMELIRFYMVGMMGPDELMALLAKKRDRIQGLEQLKARAGPPLKIIRSLPPVQLPRGDACPDPSLAPLLPTLRPVCARYLTRKVRAAIGLPDAVSTEYAEHY
ncbi:MAG: transposase [Verrucomicrobiae bacterium]|nr:transposase [Verrucomicrobiae bacterium]